MPSPLLPHLSALFCSKILKKYPCFCSTSFILSSPSYLNWLSWGFCFWYVAASLLTWSPRVSMMTDPVYEFSVLSLFAFSILPWKTFFILLWGIYVPPGSVPTQVATVALSLSVVLPHLLTSTFQNTPRLNSKTSSFLYVSSFPRCFT